MLYLLRREYHADSIMVPRADAAGLGMYKLGYSARGAVTRAAELGGQGDVSYRVVGEWVVHPPGETDTERRRNMERIENAYITGYELGDGERKAPLGDEYYLLRDATALEAAGASARRAIEGHCVQ